MAQFSNIFRLSFRDYAHEWQMSGCYVLSLASVLAPMMILFGLKFGIISTMISGLVENPHNREIRPIGSGRYMQAWLDNLAARRDVEFVIPKTRALAANIQLKSDSATRILPTELIATAEGDPLMKAISTFPSGYGQIILSHSAAKKLKVAVGDQVNGSLARQFRGKRERVHLPLKVIAIADKTVTGRQIAFVDLALLLASENFKDGRAVPALDWDGDTESKEARSFPSFRLFARSIYDVEKLVGLLEKQGVRVKANSAEISTVQSIDANLSVIFWIIAFVGAIGFSFSLGASLWANVERKKRDLSVLQLVGFNSSQIILFPWLQSLYTGILGWLLAVLAYLAAEQLINHWLAPELEIDQVLCYLLPEHFFWAFALTLIVVSIAGVSGGRRVTHLEPSDGLRET